MIIGFGIFFAVVILFMYGAAHIASEKNRSEIGWAALTGAGGGLGFAAGLPLSAVAYRQIDLGGSDLPLLLTFAPVLVGLASMIGAIVLLHRLKARAQLAGDRWPVYRVSRGVDTGAGGTLSLADGCVRFESGSDSLAIPLAAVVSASADGESVRLRFRPTREAGIYRAAWAASAGGEEVALFIPSGGPDTRQWRLRQSAAVAARIEERRAGS